MSQKRSSHRPSVASTAGRAVRKPVALGVVVMAAWAVASGVMPLPTVQRPATQFEGHFVTRDVPLTGPGARALPPAVDAGAPQALLVPPEPAPPSSPAPAEPPAAAEPGWSARIDLTDGPQFVAFSWSGRIEGRLEVRVGDGVGFQPWVPVDGSPAEGPDGRGEGAATRATSTGPIWVGHAAKAVEVRVVGGVLRDLQAQTMRWEGTLASPGSGGMPTAGAEPANPGIIPRSAWDQGRGWVPNPGCTPGPTVDPTLKMAIVHHTVQANNYGPNDVPLMIKADYDYHVGPQLQWCDLAYNFMVDRYGRIWQGRSGDMAMAVQGGHSLGFNYETMGVALVGQYQPNAGAGSPPGGYVTPDEQFAVARLIAWKFGLFGLDPNGATWYTPDTDVSPHGVWHQAGVPFPINNVVGHQDTSSTSCPGSNAEALIPAIRNQAALVMIGGASPARWAPFRSVQSLVLQQYRDVLLRDASGSEIAFWADRMVTFGADPPGISAQMLVSNEINRSQPPVYRLYSGELGRIPDVGGFRYWAGQVSQRAMTLTQVASMFASSPEFQRTYGNTSNTQFVQLLYQHVLGRAADAGGLTYWSQQLDGGASRGQVTLGFTESAEYRWYTNTTVTVQVLYLDMLRRPVDPGGLAYWGGQLNRGTPYREVVAAVYYSPEYGRRVAGL